MQSSSFVASALLASIVIWTLVRFMDDTGAGRATFGGKCFGWLPWAINAAAVATIAALTWVDARSAVRR